MAMRQHDAIRPKTGWMGDVPRAVQPQQIVRRGVQQFRNAGHGGGIGGGLAAFPLADSLLGDPQSGGKLRLADALLFAALLQ